MDKAAAATSAAVGAAAALSGAKAIVSAIGFKSVGILAGSKAAYMMSVLGGATTKAGGIVATAQAIGATSIFTSTAATLGSGGVGAAVGYVGYRVVKAFFFSVALS